MKSTSPPRQEINYWISVSPESAHTHKRTTTQRIQPLHPDLISEIHKLVRNGVTSVPTVKSELSRIVSDMFQKSSIRPDHFNSAFYPSDKCIYNHIYDAKVAISKLQEGVKLEIRNTAPSTEDSTISLTPHQEHQTPEVIWLIHLIFIRSSNTVSDLSLCITFPFRNVTRIQQLFLFWIIFHMNGKITHTQYYLPILSKFSTIMVLLCLWLLNPFLRKLLE